MKYEYFISYAFENGYGKCIITIGQKIDGDKLLLEIAEKTTILTAK